MCERYDAFNVKIIVKTFLRVSDGWCETLSDEILVFADVFLPVCFQAAGPHVEWCVTGFNVPCGQH